jgi:hypothetical protein
MCKTQPQFNKNFSSVAQQQEYQAWLAKVNDPMEVDSANANAD